MAPSILNSTSSESMGLNGVKPGEALADTNSPFKKQDDEIESLRAELLKLRQQLRVTTAERDHLRNQTSQREVQEEVLSRQGSNEADTTKRPDFSLIPGQSVGKRLSDPRIGRPKKMLVIGGGPAGLISLHELLNPFNRPKGESLDEYKIELYERRAEVGGVWYFEKENDIAKGWHHGTAGLRAREEDRHFKTMQDAGGMEMLDLSWFNNGGDGDDYGEPSANGHPSELPIINGGKKVNGQVNGHPVHRRRSSSEVSSDFCWLSYPQSAPRWPSAAYEGLVGNVLPPLLEFSSEPFPKPKGGLFPSMIETHEYMLQVAAPMRSHIKTCMEVVEVKPVYHADRSAPTWSVTSIDWTTEGAGRETTEEWDCIVAAAGAFDHPYFPDNIPGLQTLIDKKSSLIMHAKTYPGPRPFVNQHNKIVVVGNANSANDIAAHLAPLNSSGPLYRCIRHESKFAHLPDSRIKDVPEIASIKTSFDRATLSLTLVDGHRLDGVTKLIFASGYQYSFPWLSVPSVAPGAARDDTVPASLHGAVPNLHNATFHAAAPTLAFVGLSQGSTPMPLAEIQARSAARAWFGLLAFPDTTEGMLASFRARAEELGLKEGSAAGWRTLHMVRGGPERVLTAALLDVLEEGEEGATKGLFRWDEWREGIVKTMRQVKEGELRRLRGLKVAAGGVDGGVGGVLSFGPVSFGPVMGQKFEPVYGQVKGVEGRGRALML